jgi:hypothetical protein
MVTNKLLFPLVLYVSSANALITFALSVFLFCLSFTALTSVYYSVTLGWPLKKCQLFFVPLYLWHSVVRGPLILFEHPHVYKQLTTCSSVGLLLLKKLFSFYEHWKFFLSHLQDNTLSRINPMHFNVYCLACPPPKNQSILMQCTTFRKNLVFTAGVGRPSPNPRSCGSTPVGCPLQLPSVSGSLVTTRQTVVTCTTWTSLFVLASYHYVVNCTLSVLCLDLILWLLRRH